MAVPSKFPKEYSRTTTIHVHHHQTFLWPSLKQGVAVEVHRLLWSFALWAVGLRYKHWHWPVLANWRPMCFGSSRIFEALNQMRLNGEIRINALNIIFTFLIRWVSTFRSSCSDHSGIYTYRRHDHPCAPLHSCLFPVHYILGMWHA